MEGLFNEWEPNCWFPHVEDDLRMGMFEIEEVKIEYALSEEKQLVFDRMSGEMVLAGVKLEPAEVNELARFCVENRSMIYESCSQKEVV